MTKTTYIAGIVLAIAFLAVVNVQADMVTFSFDKKSGPDKFSGVAELLSLTATKNENNGIDFLFTSSWNGGSDKNGGRGTLMRILGGYDQLNPAGIELARATDLFTSGTGGKIMGSSTNPYYINTSDISLLDEEAGTWGMQFTLNFADGKTWGDFTNLLTVNNPSTPGRDDVQFTFNFGFLDDTWATTGTLPRTDYAAFVTNPGAYYPSEGADGAVPEPATLAVLGMGLAGLGLVSRRRQK